MSPAPCFDDQVYTTLSWADEKSACRVLFQECSIEKGDNATKDVEVRQEPSLSLRNLHKGGSIDVSSTTSSNRGDNLPALTDNMSSSEPSSLDEQDTFRLQLTRQELHVQPIATNQVIDIIDVHRFDPGLTASRSAEYYLGLASSSNDYTQGTSGSLERDARVDLVTSRGSSGGREDLDDEYRNDYSGTFGREG